MSSSAATRANPPRASSVGRELCQARGAPPAARELRLPCKLCWARGAPPPRPEEASSDGHGGERPEGYGGERAEEASSDGHGGKRPEGVHEGGGEAPGAVHRESGGDGDPLRSGNKASGRGGLATWIARSESWRLCWISFLAQLCYL